MEIFFLQDQKPNCYKRLYRGLDHPVTPIAHLVFDEMANFFGTALATLKIVLY